MIQQQERITPSGGVHVDGRPTVWGLTARELHDAYWRSRGVQCVRLGREQPIERAADLYMLIMPVDLVVFDLSSLAPDLVWRAAAVTRLRVADRDPIPYREHLRLDHQGLVERIERRYEPRMRSSCRVLLTRRKHLARRWTSNSSAREGWRTIRRFVRQADVDHRRCTGKSMSAERHEGQIAFLTELVAAWPRPDLALHGVEQTRAGVWAPRGVSIPDEAAVIGPVWIGYRPNDLPAGPIVGPAWIADEEADAGDERLPVRALRIAEIETDVSRVPPTRVRQSRRCYALAKRTLDLVMSAIGLLLFAPFFGVIALLIVLYDGPPVLYGHLRQTRGGHPFRCWKFRTMRRDAEQMKEILQARNACDGPQFYIEDDPRTTRIGRALRWYHLDEFPQLWNVLRGEMSLVGPRPSPDDENQICAAWRDLRLSVRPGITGLWQLKRTRRPGVDFQEWIRYDVQYVEDANLWMDITILVVTVRGVLSKVVRSAARSLLPKRTVE